MHLEDSLQAPPGKHGDFVRTKARGLQMSDDRAAIFHSNRYHAKAACEHCEGIIRHEPWCITLHPLVFYATQIVSDPSKLTVGDAIILHSLGVIWGAKACQGTCKKDKTAQPRAQLQA
jgi:hypothetical protein